MYFMLLIFSLTKSSKNILSSSISNSFNVPNFDNNEKSSSSSISIDFKFNLSIDPKYSNPSKV